MAWPAVVGALGAAAKGAGSILSGLGIGSDSGLDPGSMWYHGYHWDKLRAEHLPTAAGKGLLNFARASGIHPLAALGHVPSTSPGRYVGASRRGSGMDLERMGQGVQKIASAFEDVDLDIKREHLKSLRLENQAKQAEIMTTSEGVVTDRRNVDVTVSGQDPVQYTPEQIPLKQTEGVSVGIWPGNAIVTGKQ